MNVAIMEGDRYVDQGLDLMKEKGVRSISFLTRARSSASLARQTYSSR